MSTDAVLQVILKRFHWGMRTEKRSVIRVKIMNGLQFLRWGIREMLLLYRNDEEKWTTLFWKGCSFWDGKFLFFTETKSLQEPKYILTQILTFKTFMNFFFKEEQKPFCGCRHLGTLLGNLIMHAWRERIEESYS